MKPTKKSVLVVRKTKKSYFRFVWLHRKVSKITKLLLTEVKWGEAALFGHSRTDYD